MRVYVLVNGILTMPGSSGNWTGRAATGLITRTGSPVEKVEYLSFATFHRLLGQRNRVKKLARTLSFYSSGDWEIHLVAHSNGAGVVLGALQYLDWPRMEAIHLFSPACQRDFRKNGLRKAQDRRRVRHVWVYQAGKDLALRLADNCLGRFFGYGDLGKDGPLNHNQSHTTVVHRSEWGHSDWWTDDNLPWSLEQITSVP